MSYSVFRANLSKSSHLFLQPGNVHHSAMGKIPVCLLKCYMSNEIRRASVTYLSAKFFKTGSLKMDEYDIGGFNQGQNVQPDLADFCTLHACK